MSRPATGDGEPEFEACPVSDEPLERPEQLPEVPGDRVLIDWSMEGRRTVLLRCGKREIWRQRTFTNARELTAVFEICRARYGRRFAGIRLDDNAKAAIVDCFAGQEVIDYLKASLEPDPSCPATRFPIDRTSEVSEAPPGWRRRWFGVSDSFFLSFSCAPSGLIEVHLLDTSDDLTDHSRRFLVDGAALLQDLL